MTTVVRTKMSKVARVNRWRALNMLGVFAVLLVMTVARTDFIGGILTAIWWTLTCHFNAQCDLVNEET